MNNRLTEAARQLSFPNRDYDISNIAHRIKLGKAMVDLAHKEVLQ